MAYVQKRMTEQDEQNGLTRQGSGLTQSSSNAVSPQSGQPSTKAPQDFTRTGFNTTSKILDRNQGANTAAVENRLLSPLAEQVSGEKQRIQGIGSDYENTQKAKLAPQYNPIDQSTLQAATKGGDAFASVQKILGQKGPQKIEALEKPAVSQIPLTQFANNREFAPLLNQTSKGPYTRGMGALDMASLARSGTPQALQKRVGEFQGQLNDAASALQANQNNVQGFADSAADTQRNQIIQALQGLKGDVLGQSGKTVAERKAASEAKIQQEKNAARNEYLKQLEDKVFLRKNYQSGPNSDDIDTLSAIAKQKADDESFLGQVNQGNFGSGIGTDEALQLNNIATLLGENPNVSGDTGVDQGGFSYNPQNFQSFLADLFQKNLKPLNDSLSSAKSQLPLPGNETSKLPIPGNEGGATGRGSGAGSSGADRLKPYIDKAKAAGKKAASMRAPLRRNPVDVLKASLIKNYKARAQEISKQATQTAQTPLPIPGNEGGATGPVQTSKAPETIIDAILNAPAKAEEKAKKLDPRNWRL